MHWDYLSVSKWLWKKVDWMMSEITGTSNAITPSTPHWRNPCYQTVEAIWAMAAATLLVIADSCTWCSLTSYNNNNRSPLLVVLLNDHHSLSCGLYLLFFCLESQEQNDPRFLWWLDSVTQKEQLYVRNYRYLQVTWQ